MKKESKIEIGGDSICWIPKTVIYKGKEYKAPLNILPSLAYDVIVEMLKQRQKQRV